MKLFSALLRSAIAGLCAGLVVAGPAQAQFQRGTPTPSSIGAIPQSSLGQPNGPASLGSGGTVPAAQIPFGTATGTVVSGDDLRLGDGYVPGCTRGALPKSPVTLSSSPYSSLTHMRHACPGGASAVRYVFGGYYASPQDKPLGTGPGVYRCKDPVQVAAGGSGYVVGELVTLPTTNLAGLACVVRVLSVNSGAITQVQVQVPGVFSAPLGAAVAQSATSGSGTGATFTASWDLGAYLVHLGVEPVWNTQTLSGVNSIVRAKSIAAPVVVNAAGALVDNPDIVVPYGGIAVTDPILVNVPAGGAIGDRIYTVGGAIPLGHHNGPYPSGGGNGIDGYYNNGPDWSFTNNSIGATAAAAGGAGEFSPLAILVKPKVPVKSCIIIGDSIAADTTGVSGAGSDTGDASGNMGWVERALADQVAWTNYSVPSNQLQFLMNLPSASPVGQRANLEALLKVAHFGCAIVELSINDFRAGVTYANYAIQEAQFIAFLRANGVKAVFGVTTTPDDAAKDASATTSGNNQIQARNTAIRNGTGCVGQGFTACYDFGTLVETSLGSNTWTSPSGTYGSGDGLHPTPAMHALMGAAFGAWILQQIPY